MDRVTKSNQSLWPNWVEKKKKKKSWRQTAVICVVNHDLGVFTLITFWIVTKYLFKVLKFSPYPGKTNSVFGHKIQPATVQDPEQDRDIKTIHIPKTMTAAPFLQVFHENVYLMRQFEKKLLWGP